MREEDIGVQRTLKEFEKTHPELESRLRKVNDSYPEFVLAMLLDCRLYSDKCPDLEQKLIEYIDNHPEADIEEVSDYEEDCIGIPWCDDEDVWHRWDKIISEEEAQRIAQEEYCDD